MIRMGTGIAVLLAIALGLGSQVQGQAIPWRQDLNTARMEAAQTGRLVLVHFWATWCQPCNRLEKNVFSQPSVAAAITASYIPVKLDADQNAALAKSFGIQGVPHDVILTPNGRLIESTVSPATADGYIARMGQIAANYMATVNRPLMAGQPATNPPVATGPTNPPWAAPPPAVHSPAPNSPAATQPQIAQQTAGQTMSGSRNIHPAYADLLPQQPAPPAHPVDQPLAGSQFPADQMAANIPSSRGLEPSAASGPANQVGQNPVPYLEGAVPRPNYPSAPYYQASTQQQPTYGLADRSPPPQNRVQAVSSQHPTAGQQGTGSSGIASNTTFPLGLDGYCPVTLRTSPYPANDPRRWVKGNPQWSATHRGRMYFFAGQAEQDMFLQASNADLYAPVLSGMDPVLALDNQEMVPGKRNHGVLYRGLMFLFASEESLQQFTRNADYYTNHVRQVMRLGQPATLR